MNARWVLDGTDHILRGTELSEERNESRDRIMDRMRER